MIVIQRCMALYTCVALIVASSAAPVLATKHSGKKAETITVNPLSVEKMVDATSIFSEIEYVKLETKDASLHGHITKVLIKSDRLFVLSSSTSGKVFCFSRDGKYLYTLNKRGRGPRETGPISDIALDLYNDGILLADRDRKSVYLYSPKGERIKRFRFKFFVDEIIPLDSERIALRTSESGTPDFKLFNSSTEEFTYEAMWMYPLDDITSGANFFSTLGETVLFAPGVQDTIYEVGQIGLIPRYRINFGQHSMPEAIRKEQGRISYFYFHRENHDFAGLLNNTWENSSHVGFSYKYSKRSKPTHVLINKRNGHRVRQFQSISMDGIEITSFSARIRSSHNVNYSIIDAAMITSVLRSNSVPYGRFRNLRELASKTSMDDNSIIAIYTINPEF